MPSLTIIVPFYNEARTLKRLVEEISKLPKETYEQVIFINDGSSDDSDIVLEDALRIFNLPHAYIRKHNGGKASAVLEGLQNSQTTHAVILDADLELEVSDLTRMWKLILSGEAEAVFGYRNFKSHSSYSYRYVIGNRLISNFYGIIVNQLITDIMCGYKLFPIGLIASFPKFISGYSIEVAIPISLWKHKIKPHEIEVAYNPRNRHEGKTINVIDAIKVLFAILRYGLVLRARKI